MSQEMMTCERFAERLDRLPDEPLAAEELERLRRHAQGCPDCALLLRTQEHVSVSDADLEAAVPDHLVDTMWQRVEPHVRSRQPRYSPLLAWGWTGQRLLATGLATAAVVLLVVSSFLYGELKRLHRREELLVLELQRQGQVLEDVHALTSGLAYERTPASLTTARWLQRLPGDRALTVGELIAMLEGLPPQTSILSAREIAALFRRRPQWRIAVRDRVGSGFELHDGLQAGELILLIESLDFDPGLRLTREQLQALGGV